MLTEWLEEGCPNKFCCMCLEADDLQDNWQKWLKTITDLMLWKIMILFFQFHILCFCFLILFSISFSIFSLSYLYLLNYYHLLFIFFILFFFFIFLQFLVLRLCFMCLTVLSSIILYSWCGRG